MEDQFLTNYSNTSFLEKVKESLRECKAFRFSVSFIKKAGLVLLEKDIHEALERGVYGKVITSTYQNFTDIESLKTFRKWSQEYDNFQCHLDFECFGENGFHSKGYLFEFQDDVEIIVGSSNITRYALLKNIEWNISLSSKEKAASYQDALAEFDNLWNQTLELDDNIIDLYRFRLDYAIEKWDMDYVSIDSLSINPNSMQRKALKEIRRYRDMGVDRALVISATGSGKTYLAAFDARNFGAQRLLYVVHRDVILNDAKATFENVFKRDHTYGLFTGKKSELESDYIFASSSMLSRHLNEFDPNEFDYIVYDAYGIIGLNSKDSTDKGFLKLSPILFSPQKRLMVNLRRKHAQNEDLSAKRSAACNFGSTVSDVVPSHLLQRQSAEHTPDVDLHRSTVRYPKDVSLACAA